MSVDQTTYPLKIFGFVTEYYSENPLTIAEDGGCRAVWACARTMPNPVRMDPTGKTWGDESFLESNL
jgi:hypothetical protein